MDGHGTTTFTPQGQPFLATVAGDTVDPGHGRNGYSFRLPLVPLVTVFVLEFVCVTLEAPRRATLRTRLKFDRAGAVRAVVVQGPEAKSTMPVAEYTLPGFEPPLVRVGRETGARRARDGRDDDFGGIERLDHVVAGADAQPGEHCRVCRSSLAFVKKPRRRKRKARPFDGTRPPA